MKKMFEKLKENKVALGVVGFILFLAVLSTFGVL